jgi:predicted flap endonuclease-1-like 5' DNA nuclease
MSLLYQVVFAAKATSNHHRLALDALRHLQGEPAERWRMLFLHHHQAYLEGAKAPDTVFKDFKNHVLHVREGEWGGAIDAAQEWYRRTVRALAAREWKQAVYNAGVMSHYIVDPVQPFHTHQTEEEGVIHAAVEQSFSKSWKELQTILEVDLDGYPDLQLSDDPDWLAQAIRAGAHAANPSYELVIQHYNFALGQKDPKAGLDQEIKDSIARLIGHASVTLSRVLDRAFDEAAVAAPKVDGSLDVVFTALAGPVTWITGKMEDAQAAALVKAQYAEFQARGKVLTTLHEDDATVRRLHCEEVLGKQISSLDAAWPKETGKAHGLGAPPRVTKRPTKRDIKRLPKADAPLPGRGLFNTKPIRPAGVLPAAPAPAPMSAPVEALAPEPTDVGPIERPDRGGKPLLAGPDPVVEAPSIGPKTAARLEAVGVTTVSALLERSAEALAQALNTRHITAPVVRDWQDQARLACALPGITGRDAQTLVACGVRTPQDLARANLWELTAAAQAFAVTDDGKRLWGDKGLAEARVQGWFAAAKAVGQASQAA